MTLSREYCPKCGSSDNLVVWEDGHSFCFTPGCGKGSTTSKVSKLGTIKNFKPIVGKPISIHARRLTTQTCSKYNVVAHNDNIYFPYYDNGKVMGYKIKNPRVPKKTSFYIEGNITNLLFGNQAVHNSKIIAITSGEFDAMSIYQMTNVAGVSLSADGMADKAINYNLQWLESFEKIILCIDADSSGDKARETIGNIIRPYQLYQMVFPSGYKDANDMLMAEQSQLFTRAFWSARATPVKTIFTLDCLRSELKTNYQTPEGTPTGIDKLDHMLGGLRPGELTTVLGKPTSGKSTFSRIVFSNLLREQYKSMVVALEERPIRYGRRLLHSYIGRSMLSVQRQQLEFLIDEMTEHLIVSKLNGITPIDKVSTDIEYAVRQSKVQFVLLDNVTSGVKREEIYAQTSEYISNLASLCKDFNIHILAVCHKGRGGKDKEDMDSGYGSGAIEQLSDNIIVVGKEVDSNKLTLKLLKNRELGLPNYPYVSLSYNTNTGRYEEESTRKDAQERTTSLRQISFNKNLAKQTM